MPEPLNLRINRWIERSVYRPGDCEDILLLKRIYWVSLHLAIFLVFPLIPLSLILKIPNWTWMGIAYVVFHLIQLVIFHKVRHHIEEFGLVTQLFHILFAFTGILITGGILHSAGIVFIGLLGPLYALVFPKGRRAVLMLVFYLITLIAAAVLQPFIPPYPPITPVINNLMFLIQFAVVVVVNFFTLRYYAGQTIQMKILESSRLKELDEAKTRLYTNITHEFRTPLTIILGMADQLAVNPSGKPDEGLQMIKRNGENLLHLINQMLNLSKAEAKAMPVNYCQGDVISYLRYIFESFNSLAGSKNIRLNIQANPDQLVMDFDPDKLMQIVSNLLSNAIKFTADRGDVCMEIDGQQDKNELIIKVKDNGIGIPADKLPQLFNRFFKAEDDSYVSSKGTGIGLALTKELVTLMKGTIRVQSRPAAGTEFTVTIPVTNLSEVTHDLDRERMKSDISLFITDASKKPGRAEEAGKDSENLPILLIVEDNKDVARYIESIMSPEYSIKTAGNGQEGFDLASEEIPDIIISDVMMPVMNGFVLCEKLKTDERTSHIPVILLTAMASEAGKLEGLETGADAYVIKPFNPKEIQVRVKNLVEQRRKLRERFSRDITIAPKEIAVTSADERFLNRAMEIIEKHMSDPEFGVDMLGKEVGMSHSHLHRKIKALTNQSPVELIRSIRLKRAASLLRQKFGNVSEVAYETGFSSPAYFSDCFQKQFGKPPSEYMTGIEYRN